MNFKKWFRKKEKEFELSESELDIIRKFAFGDKSLREEAIQIYFKGLDNGLHWHSCPEMGWMDETTNPVPCFIMKELHLGKMKERMNVE